MDLEPGRTRVHEHAETGKPFAAKSHGMHKRIEPDLARSSWLVRPCRSDGWNGPDRRKLQFARVKVGHKLSAIGSPLHSASSSGILPLLAQRAAHPGRPPFEFRRPSDSQVIPLAYPLSFRSRASPSVPCRISQQANAAGRKGTMAKEICISSTPHETRLAILEDDQLAEIYYERENEYTLAGSIYNGRVTRVLPGMQSAFVDLGLERDAFLYVTDFLELEDQEESDELEKAAGTAAPLCPRAKSAIRATRSQPAAQPRPPRRHGGPRRAFAGSAAASGPTRRRKRIPISEQTAPPRSSRRFASSQPGRKRVKTSSGHPAGSRREAGRRTGAKRWRGRRRRRGGRGSRAGAPAGRVRESIDARPQNTPANRMRSRDTKEIHASASSAGRQSPQSWIADPCRALRLPSCCPASRSRKYGGTADDETPEIRARAAAPLAPLPPTSHPR